MFTHACVNAYESFNFAVLQDRMIGRNLALTVNQSLHYNMQVLHHRKVWKATSLCLCVEACCVIRTFCSISGVVMYKRTCICVKCMHGSCC